MFEKELKDRLKRIFGIAIVRYDQPGEDAEEQEGIFIKIDSASSHVTNGKATSKVIGSFSVFVNSEKMPFGYFNKRINQANPADTAPFFFYNIDQNMKYFGNLVERRTSFVYFFSTQYDPDAGEIESVDFTVTINGD